MSGIMGIFYLDGRPVESENLGRMVDTLAHRGPDGADIWSDGSIGFGHRMLWTTPESLLERLPLVNQTGDLVITADARIDNRDELIPSLGFDDRPAEKITDSQLILAAYEKWGESCPEHLLGDFAFAIWDGRKHILFCARDHMGVKPFYYHYKAGQIFAFSSEIKALLCLQEVPRQLNEVKVGDYLASMLQDKSITFYQDIFRLPPASCVTLSADGIKSRSYWFLDLDRELQLSSNEEYAEALREIFAEAVRCRLRSAFPVGSHLSGGLDSSSVTCMARQLLMQEGNCSLHTFSNIFDATPECDERPFIEAVIAQGDMIPHYVQANQLGPLSSLDQIFRYYDEAIPAPTHFLVWGLNGAAQREGVRITLDGFDGDNTISHGEGYLIELARAGRWTDFAKEAEDLAKLVGASPVKTLRCYGTPYLEELARHGQWISFIRETTQVSKNFNVSQRKLFLDYGLKPWLPQSLLSAIRSLRGHSQPAKNDHSIMNGNFVERIGLKNRVQVLRGSLSSQPSTEREYHSRNITAGILTQGLEILDHYAAAFYLEARHPYMDKRLIEFCLSLPSEQKLNKGWSRLVMRRAMKNVLPEEVRVRRHKSDMSASFFYGLMKHNRGLLDEVMHNHLNSVADYVDTKTFRRIYEELTSVSQAKALESLLDISLWKVTLFALWLRQAQLKP